MPRIDDDALEQRLGGDRLAEIFVDAEPDRLDHALRSTWPVSMMIGTSGSAKVLRRAHDAHEFGAVQLRHFPVEDHDIRNECADGFEAVGAVGGLVDVLDADGSSRLRITLRM